MENEEDRNEYVLNDYTLIFRSTSRFSKPLRWDVAQFDEVTLDLIFKLIKKLPLKTLANPHLLVRELSAFVNSPDDDGILVGNWSGNYSEGVSPSFWSGSAKIIHKYLNTEAPVKYGQCWVYAGVLNTLCRALGICCRIITNFDSLHDSDRTLDAEYYYDENKKFMKDMSVDSVWY